MIGLSTPLRSISAEAREISLGEIKRFSRGGRIAPCQVEVEEGVEILEELAKVEADVEGAVVEAADVPEVSREPPPKGAPLVSCFL